MNSQQKNRGVKPVVVSWFHVSKGVTAAIERLDAFRQDCFQVLERGDREKEHHKFSRLERRIKEAILLLKDGVGVETHREAPTEPTDEFKF